mgnify:CR=1 FL=1
MGCNWGKLLPLLGLSDAPDFAPAMEEEAAAELVAVGVESRVAELVAVGVESRVAELPSSVSSCRLSLLAGRPGPALAPPTLSAVRATSYP